MAGKRLFGAVRKLPSGRWQARYRDPSGRVHTAPRTYPTKTEAAQFLAGVQTDMSRGQYIDPSAGRISFETWSKKWLSRPGKRAASVVRDTQALGVFMEELGPMPLSALLPGDIQAAVDARCKVAAPATVVRDVAALRACINAAVDTDLIGRSPVRKVALPKVRPPERECLSPDDLAKLVAELPDHYATLVLSAGVLGLRWGEAVGLRVRDLDFMRRTLTVAQVVEELAGHLRVVPEAKSRASLRTLSVPPFLMDTLAGHLARFRPGLEADSEELVFLGPRGGVLRRRFGDRILAPAAERAGLNGLTFHALRHAAVTALVDEGVHPRVMQARAGHDTARLTMERYAHVTDGADREAAAALEARFAPAMAGASGTRVARRVPGST